MLLDAGAGPDWRFRDATAGREIGRSEGLALASLAMFAGGAFSGHPGDPLRADAGTLERLADETLTAGFQVSDANPLPGIAGRADLLRRLGRTVAAAPAIFATEDEPRPGGLFDHLAGLAAGGRIEAATILRELLIHLGPIWPSRITLGGIPLGDCWRHPALRMDDATDRLVPLHKLSQWLAYSLIEPMQARGHRGDRRRRPDRACGISQWRPVHRFRRAGVPRSRGRRAAATMSPRRWWSNGARSPSACSTAWRRWCGCGCGAMRTTFRSRASCRAAPGPPGRMLARRLRPDGAPPVAVDQRRHGVLSKGGRTMEGVTVVRHPLVQHKLTLLRDKSRSTKSFRELCRELGILMCYEVTRDLPLDHVEIETPMATMRAPRIAGKKLVFAPILRAGMTLVEGMLELVPAARVAHIGLYRDPDTLVAVEYFFKAPIDIAERQVIVISPVIATGNTAVAAVDRVKERGARDIRFVCLITVPLAIERLRGIHPDVPIWTAAIDERLDEDAYIIPGLGDAGDRAFGTK